ncbi:hypothetical protein [Micromonospora polyrhachis]|uniref:Uncharacterized protein n=1 Tax=Micromonospora polyrhachis TaxID=1282883 RepID=A0A7W7SU16_9ACTN|nr:hypothetical protein [Micromonospora polyrhachis]MBB4960982.1 hypothetical protein [Micromonospora polyrhachis]
MSRLFSKKNTLAGLATAGVLAVGVAAPTLAFAQDGGDATAKPSTSSSTTEGDKHEQHRTERQSEFAKALADELGVPQDKVEAALTKLREQHKAEVAEKRDEWKQRAGENADENKADRQAKLKERLDQAVADGKLTQEQADAIVKAYEAGVLPGPGGPGGRGHGGPVETPEGTTGK